MKVLLAYLAIFALWIALPVFVFWGWVLNIIALVHMIKLDQINLMLLVRAIGVPAFPLGWILGWFA